MNTDRHGQHGLVRISESILSLSPPSPSTFIRVHRWSIRA
ncbi:hypothetical protein TVNIR_1277 [Thioalkalivibrio nitratireducens DSM 14787]|uniref:Uncharacterized protein n=1 Tax=Thioalkalivibrio nitratireducens (strain DSM 14787 / UNIQEM 213 / ALEN2) TaxID=1255043 RepID=L0DVE9_THIND|nr:hypothetical protein TVNIR_1277 [Thioalkalivibrio nitratireducens DSM 14787]